MRLIIIFFLLISYAFADDTQNNVSGSNTYIDDGMTTNTTYQSGSSSNSTTTNNSTSNIRSAPPSAYAPNVTNSGSDICSVGKSVGLQTFGLGISGGGGFRDETCERIKLARELKAHGMSVAGVALLCQDPRVFIAMENSKTPCPIDGLIGAEATKRWKQYGKLRPDYELYVKKLKVLEEAQIKKELKFQKDFNKANKK
jgi:hypothetical protein